MSKNYDNLNNNDVFLLFSINSPSFDSSGHRRSAVIFAQN